MAYFDFNPFGNQALIVKFTCDECGEQVISEEIGMPEPNYAADTARDSQTDNEGYAICENCNKEFNISIYVTYAGGDGSIEELSETDDIYIEVEEIPEKLDDYYEEQIDAIIHSLNFITQFKSEVSNLTSLNNIEIESNELQETLQRQLFSGAITCLEDYLATTLIQQVLNDEEYFKNFIRTFKNIQNRKFTLSEIYEKLDNIRDIVKKELVDVIYHDLPKVKGMYQDTLKIDFPDIKELMKVIQTRHDMVHRNGKNKEGEKIEISKEVVQTVIDEVEKFVTDIDEKITKAQQ